MSELALSAEEIARLRYRRSLLLRGMEHLREMHLDGEISRRRFNREYAEALDSVNAINKELGQ